MKLLSTAIAAAALITAADAKGFSGFYAGADLGLSNLNSTWKTRARTDISFADNLHTHKFGSSLGLFLGYNKVFSNCMSAGLEFGGDFNFNKNETLSRVVTRKYAMKRSGFDWDLVAKFGALINPKTLAFVGFGVKSMKVRYNYSEEDTTPAKFTIKNSRVRPTYQFGFENLMGSSESVALRLVYAFTQGSKKSIASNNASLAFAPTTLSTVKNNEHQVKLGVSYRF